MIKNDTLIYVKTTETCNLNCNHCFTNGINGAKIFFNPDAVAKWCNELKDLVPEMTTHFEYHGGEPFLAPVDDMWRFYELTQEKWNGDATYGITTNLVLKLSDKRLDFLDTVCEKRIGTSWDPTIRFDNEKQRDLFESNVKLLLDRGYTIKLFVSLTNDTIDMGPEKLLRYVRDLGVQEMALERITHDGNATRNPVFPSNLSLQNYFLDMHRFMESTGARNWFHNEFMENIYTKFETGFTGAGTFCRDCEQKLFTINADGSIAGCPNSAPTSAFGHIVESPQMVIDSPGRCNVIMEELSRDPRCYDCKVYKYCKGDCHQLAWEGDICGAPRFLMKELDKKHGNIN